MCALLMSGCVAGRGEGDPEFRERLLATIPEEGGVAIPTAFSADGRKAAWVRRQGGMSRAVSGAWMGRPYDVVC